MYFNFSGKSHILWLLAFSWVELLENLIENCVLSVVERCPVCSLVTCLLWLLYNLCIVYYFPPWLLHYHIQAHMVSFVVLCSFAIEIEKFFHSVLCVWKIDFHPIVFQDSFPRMRFCFCAIDALAAIDDWIDAIASRAVLIWFNGQGVFIITIIIILLLLLVFIVKGTLSLLLE